MNEFTVDTINLSFRDPETDLPLKANIYHVEGIYDADGNFRDLSIGQLVMAICLDRAAELESNIISKMELMARTTDNLEALTTIQEALVESGSLSFPADFSFTCVYYGDPAKGEPEIVFDNTTGEPIKGDVNNPNFTNLCAAAHVDLEKAKNEDGTYNYDALVSAFTTKMNALNSVSQTDMIELQSLTSKRDQSYDLISNVLKALHNVLMGNANNVA